MEKLMAHGRELCLRQHRFFAPMILICEGYARLLLVDREVAVVSEPLDCLSESTVLSTFLYRYINATPERRGYDPTVSLASEDEHVFFMQVKTQFPPDSYLHETFDKAATLGWPTYKLRISAQWSKDEDGRFATHDCTHSTREFLVGRPAYDPAMAAGRCTLGFAAWDVSRQRSVFIKDYWRTYGPDTLTEYEVYRRLAEGDHPVRNIPTILGGGDVPGSFEIASLRPCFQGDPFLAATRIYTRLVIKEICRSLQSFQDWRELVSVVHDALLAAWEDHGILHRDLSVGNILIFDGIPGSVASCVGLLCDWNTACSKEQVFDLPPSQGTRSGTWQFMSAGLQMYDWKPHLLSDDLESFMHVLNWIALQHLDTRESKNLRALAEHVHHMYNIALP
ncbi:hypothetical protein FKP32DRAFT_1575603, partial [Trametes sanguinea]